MQALKNSVDDRNGNEEKEETQKCSRSQRSTLSPGDGDPVGVKEKGEEEEEEE